ncbi:Acidic endochitinase [Spatholobus suberectus]|nr:Acidic endochitinase [Spatholobus suberectus]
MASKRQALVIFLLSLFTFSSSHPDNGGIAVCWGQDNGDGELTTTCDSGKYAIVLLAFLNTFGAGRTPAWNFAGHCHNGALKKCTELESEIKYCQAKGIKVLLSIGGAPGYSAYSLSSAEDAKDVAGYLYKNFLSGQYGPLGSSLRIVPQCPIPIYYLGKAIETKLFDSIFVQFYNNPGCSYSTGNTASLLASWDDWVKLVASNNSLFVGLPAAQSAAGSGYIPPDVLNSEVLP